MTPTAYINYRPMTEGAELSWDKIRGTASHIALFTQGQLDSAIAAEREACAVAVERMVHGNVRTCAATIRARGTP